MLRGLFFDLNSWGCGGFPSTTDLGLMNGLLPQARKVDPRPISNQTFMEEAKHPKNKCRPKAILLAGMRPSPSATRRNHRSEDRHLQEVGLREK